MNVLEARGENAGRDRREDDRITTVQPVMEIDGRRCRVVDFSALGCRVIVPAAYRRLGMKGKATLLLQAAGYRAYRRVSFEVVHVLGNAVGLEYETIETLTDSSECLF